MIQITLNDDSIVTVRMCKDGRQNMIFHGLDKAMTMPVGIKITINLAQKLYDQLKSNV